MNPRYQINMFLDGNDQKALNQLREKGYSPRDIFRAGYVALLQIEDTSQTLKSD